MNMKYILDENKNPIPCNDLMIWGKWIENNNNKIIKQTLFKNILISTIFLGLEHNLLGRGEPILFETMIFGGKLDQYQERYSNYKEALDGHKKMVEEVIEVEKCERLNLGLTIKITKTNTK